MTPTELRDAIVTLAQDNWLVKSGGTSGTAKVSTSWRSAHN